ncbi:MAG: hypothetical protein JSU00_04245 [Acidobacteria bacterium]|nr:hypothetical protein [Acidobacteriota bacterium]
MEPRRRCLYCDRTVRWLARLRWLRFCSQSCRNEYFARMTRVAVEHVGRRQEPSPATGPRLQE